MNHKISRSTLIKILKEHGYKKYSNIGDHNRMYKSGDCTTAIHIPKDQIICNKIIRRIERKTKIRILDRNV